MKTFFKILLVLGLVMVLASVATGVVLLGAISDADGMHIVINGQEWNGGTLEMGDAFGLFLAVMICGLVACVVVPLVLLLGVGLPLLLVGGLFVLCMAAVLGAGAVLGSPLLLIALVVWLLVRDRTPRASRRAAREARRMQQAHPQP
ncbi:hypothetical protein [Roseateles terrae]|uniref:Uncharacterized membrane protein YvlD (DUF360 family) n=1 Tax=Roseateles terrae TaxID=431060 RepID=A0ABR6GRB2_9BURK|nr:hypothetical protein [Roseateles terrae]MBB3194663.1 uncharacterized membrane protein YvlD (DUF360 family) [Roseateles terrae]OWQ86048.1 hypothetical protein CDN98_15220 [Roseateles terrae]